MSQGRDETPTPKFIQDFAAAVYPDAPNLALATFNEEKFIIDAVGRIRELERSLAQAQARIGELERELDQEKMAYLELKLSYDGVCAQLRGINSASQSK